MVSVFLNKLFVWSWNYLFVGGNRSPSPNASPRACIVVKSWRGSPNPPRLAPQPQGLHLRYNLVGFRDPNAPLVSQKPTSKTIPPWQNYHILSSYHEIDTKVNWCILPIYSLLLISLVFWRCIHKLKRKPSYRGKKRKDENRKSHR